MNYYEELGVSPAASLDEIRQAYRNLARLLHPDQQEDPALRQAAEWQMRRLNLLLTTLADPLQRQQYDASLERALESRTLYPAVTTGFRARFSGWAAARIQPATWSWLLACAAGLAGLAWFAGRVQSTEARPTVAGSVPSEMPAPKPSASVKTIAASQARSGDKAGSSAASRGSKARVLSDELVKTRRELRTLRAAYREASKQITKLRSRNVEASLLPVPPKISVDQDHLLAARTPVPELPAASISAPVQPERKLGGRWFYVPSSSARPERGLYPPVFIELFIEEDGLNIRGKYRARYRVTDRAIPSDVAFQFEGPLSEGAKTLAWTGSGGAEGHVELKLLSDTLLQVRWDAIRLGDELGLASGRAVLTRGH